MSTTSRNICRHVRAPSPSSVDQRESLIGIADLPPAEFAHAFAQLLAPQGAQIRPEDARWIEDVEYIEAVRKRNLEDLSDAQLLELISAQVRVADRAAVHKRELASILKAQQVLRSPRSPDEKRGSATAEPAGPSSSQSAAGAAEAARQPAGG